MPIAQICIFGRNLEKYIFSLEGCQITYQQSKLKFMKKMIVLLGFIAFFTSANSTTALSPATKTPVKADEVYLPVGTTGHLISLMDLSRISVKGFETLSGKKMKFLDKMNFKLGQRELKKSINR